MLLAGASVRASADLGDAGSDAEHPSLLEHRDVAEDDVLVVLGILDDPDPRRRRVADRLRVGETRARRRRRRLVRPGRR